MKKDFKTLILFDDKYKNAITYSNYMSPKTKKYKILWHVGDYFKCPKEGRIIVARYENNKYVEILRFDSNVDSDEIVEWAYLDDLI